MEFRVIEKQKKLLISKGWPRLTHRDKLTVSITEVSNLEFQTNNLPSHPTFYAPNNSIYFPIKYLLFVTRMSLTYADTYVNRGFFIRKMEPTIYLHEKNNVYPLFWCKKAEDVKNEQSFPVLFLMIVNIEGSKKDLIIFPHLYENSYLVLRCPICGEITKRKLTKTIIQKTTKREFTLKKTLHKCAREVYQPNNIIMDFVGFYIEDLFMDYISAKKSDKQALVYPYISNPFYKDVENLPTKLAISKVKYSAYKNKNLPNDYLLMENKNFGDMGVVVNKLLFDRLSKSNMLYFMLVSKKEQ